VSHRVGLALFALFALFLLSPASAFADGIVGGDGNGGSGGGDAQISTWVIGALNGGVSKPVGATTCTAWELFNGSNMGGMSDPRIIDPVTGDVFLVYFRICDGIYQFVYVGPTDPIEIAEVAYQHVSALVRRPEVGFSPPIDKMIVNFETWLGVTPQQPVTATAAIPGLSATVTAVPTSIEWTTGSHVAGDTTKIQCEPWGSTETSKGGCAWTPAYPSVGKGTGTTDLRYHGSVTIVWKVSWQATNGARGTLDDLRTTTPVQMTVQEIQTIGG
jgi:hypothetical protein